MVGSVGHLPCFKDLIAVLFECFLIISLGYLSCRFKLISNQAKDLNSYLTTFALPMIIFLNIAQMEFQTINLSFLLCMLTAKLFVFMTVTILTLTISYPSNFGYAGSLSILATQSNDFALGYPLIKSLYGEAKPEMLNYLSLMAPIQLLLLNPLGIMMLEYHKSQLEASKKKETECPSQASACQLCNPILANKPDNLRRSKGLINANKQELRLRKHMTLPKTTRNSLASGFIASPVDIDSASRRAELAADEQLAKCASQADGHTAVGSIGYQHRNIKSLALVLPVRTAESGSDSEESFDTMNEPFVRNGNHPKDFGSPPDTNIQYGIDVQPVLRANSPNQRSLDNQQPITVSVISGRRGSPDMFENCVCQGPAPVSIVAREKKINLSFLKALATNPLIIASVVALVVNVVNGPELPKFVTRVSNTIAASFAAPALLVVGLSMHGKFELLMRHPNDLLLSSILVLTKVLILPNLMRTLALMILPNYTPAEEIPYLIDFSFLYGLLPTAPTACIIAKQYGVLANVVSISMLLSTFISAPLMLASSAIINPSTVIKVDEIESIISQTVKVSGVVTLSLASLTLYAFWKSKERINYINLINMPEMACRRIRNSIKTSPTHIFLFLLTISQAMVGIGAFIWYFVDSSRADIPVIHPTNVTDDNPTLVDPIADHDLVKDTWADVSHLDFGLRVIFRAQYVLSSSGLMLVRFVILCIIVTMTARRFRGDVIARKASSLLVKIYLTLCACLVIWLIFDSEKLRLLPIEASIPSQPVSLYVRLIYNITILILALPLFAMIIRSDNRQKKSMLKSTQDYDQEGEVGSALAKRPFVKSSISISSDSSSALTTNTNLELNTTTNQTPIDTNNNQQLSLCDSLSIVLDCKPSEMGRQRPASPLEDQNINPPINMFGSYGAIVAGQRIASINESQPNRSYEIDESPTNSYSIPTRCLNQVHIAEFNKFSILIVFMLVDSTLNMTSITQKLLQSQPTGTYRQIEVMGVALEFGQGLLTFLMYGMKGLFN